MRRIRGPRGIEEGRVIAIGQLIEAGVGESEKTGRKDRLHPDNNIPAV